MKLRLAMIRWFGVFVVPVLLMLPALDAVWHLDGVGSGALSCCLRTAGGHLMAGNCDRLKTVRLTGLSFSRCSLWSGGGPPRRRFLSRLLTLTDAMR